MVILAWAAAGVGRLLRQFADTLIGRVIRWRFAEDVAAMKVMAGRDLDSWNRRKIGRPRLRWEGPSSVLAGARWWETIAP